MKKAIKFIFDCFFAPNWCYLEVMIIPLLYWNYPWYWYYPAILIVMIVCRSINFLINKVFYHAI